MDGFVIYDFKIDVWRPTTLPMKRLADYASELAKLFGCSADVHLMKVRVGCATPEIAVAQKVQPHVATRLALVGTPDAPDDIQRSYFKVNDYLREDGGSAVLRIKHGARVIAFPGCKTPLADEVVLHEAGTLDGVVIRVGGVEDTVPVWLEGENRQQLQCKSSRAIAKELAAHLFGHPVRVNGNGKWRRNTARTWDLEEFTIKGWEALADTSLDDVVNAMREVEGSDWQSVENPQAEWLRMRGES